MSAGRRIRRCTIFALLVIGGGAEAASPADAYVAGPATIWTIAGDGTNCSTATCGDGPNALTAQVAGARGIALDATGNVYLGDTNNGRIRKLTPNGAISTIAGHGFIGCPSATSPCGDGPDAIAAIINPAGLAADAAGNVYLADQQINKVRKITPAGAISTIAGSGLQCATPSSSCGDGPNALAAQLGSPGGVAVDGAGNVYIADQFDSKIRKVTAAGAISTIAGTGGACATPTTTCGDGPTATAAQLAFPFGVAVDDLGNVYVADTANSKIRKITPAGAISTIAGDGNQCASPTSPCGDGGGALSAQLKSPVAVAVDGGQRVYVSDLGDNRVRRINADGSIVTIAGTGATCAVFGCGDGGPAPLATFGGIFGLAVDPSGANVFVGDFSRTVRWISGPPAGTPGATGPLGPGGAAGTAGGAGPSGAPGVGIPGATGATGATGRTGKTGKTGKAGRNARVTCKVGKPKRGKVRVVCTTKLLKTRSARVRLLRFGRTWATGIVSGGTLNLRSAHRLRAGMYTLIVAGRSARQEIHLH